METNDVKKALYRQNPEAQLIRVRRGKLYYSCSFIDESNVNWLTFEIPFADMGDADFLPIMPAKLLVRWLINA